MVEPSLSALPPENFGFGDMETEEEPLDAELQEALTTLMGQSAPTAALDPRIQADPRTQQSVISDEQLQKLETSLPALLDAHDQMMADRWKRDEEIEAAYDMKPDSRMQGAYPGAARMVSEALMAKVDQATARIGRGLLEVTPLMRVTPVTSPVATAEPILELAKSAERFLESYGKRVLRIDEKLPQAVLRFCKVGTAVFYVTWEEEATPMGFHNLQGGQEFTEQETGNVVLRLIRNRDVILWPSWSINWQKEAELIGHRTVMTLTAFRTFAARVGVPPDIQRQIENYSQGGEPSGSSGNTFGDLPDASRSGIDTSQVTSLPNQQLVLITELWGRQVIGDEAKAARFRCFYHEGLRKILWIGANPNFKGNHPYYPVRYKIKDGSGWGDGVGQEVFMAHVADTAFRNLEIDNLMSSAFDILAYDRGAVQDQIADRMFPGARVPVDGDPHETLQTMSLSSNGPLELLYQAINANEARATSASGQAAVLQGMGDPTLKSGGGTGAIMALIEQAGKKFGAVDANVRRELSDIYAAVLDLVWQYAPNGMVFEYAGEGDAMILEQARFVPQRGGTADSFLRIVAEAPSAANNKEMAKNHYAMLYNFLQQHIQVEIPLAQQVYMQSNPAGWIPYLTNVLNFLTYVVDKMLEINDLGGLRERLQTMQIQPPTPAEQQLNQAMAMIQQLQMQIQQMGGGQPPPGGPPAQPGPPPPQGAPA